MNKKMQYGHQKETILKCEITFSELAHRYKYDFYKEINVTEHKRTLLKLRKYSTFQKKRVGASTNRPQAKSRAINKNRAVDTKGRAINILVTLTLTHSKNLAMQASHPSDLGV